MKRLAKSDPLVVCINDEETGENIIAGSGELHVEICLNDLVNEYAQIEIIKGDPIVSYRETVKKESTVAMAKSANSQNRLFCSCEPISTELCEAIEQGDIPFRDAKARIKILSDKYNWDKGLGNKIWGFGPLGEGANVLVDLTQGCQYMNEIQEHMYVGFGIVTKNGVLCEENMRGVRFNVTDTYLHQDSIHRGGGQITPATRRVLYATQLLSEPSLLEPIFLVEITCPQECTSAVYEVMMQRRGNVDEQIEVEGTPLVIMKAYLPVSESFGFTGYLREKTGGKAFPNCVFDHWEIMTGDALDPADKLGKLVCQVRKRKGLSENVPDVKKYMDKL